MADRSLVYTDLRRAQVDHIYTTDPVVRGYTWAGMPPSEPPTPTNVTPGSFRPTLPQPLAMPSNTDTHAHQH